MNAGLLDGIKQRAAELAAPIDGGAGVDASYDDAFGVVKGEVDKLTSVSGGLPNWGAVVEQGKLLCSSKTKDFRVLAWMAVGGWYVSGLPGLAEGLFGLEAVCAVHWEGMFPTVKRLRARANLVTWLSEQSGAAVAAFVPVAGDADALAACEAAAEALQEQLAARFGEEYPGMGALRSALRQKRLELPKPAPVAPVAAPVAAPAAVPPTPAAVAAPAAPQPASPNNAPVVAPPQVAAAPAPTVVVDAPQVSGVEGVDNALRAVSKSILDCARALRSANPGDAQAYRLQRLGLWLPVKDLPPAESGATKLPPPPPERLKKISALQSAEKWLEVLQEAEGSTAAHLFWLDLHRLVALAMDRLGPLFAVARASVVAETVGFVRRFPAIVELGFRGGVPFADAVTRGWLEEELAKTGGGGNAGPVDEEEVELRRRFEEATELVNGGKVPDGLALAAMLARRGNDARGRFRAQLTTARLALNGNKARVALSMADALLVDVDRHGLDVWEPDLAAQALALFVEASKVAKSKDLSRIDGAVDRLCRLDPAAATKLIAD